MKRIMIVFGEMGAGKNYWGEKLAKTFNLEFFDGDTVAPPELMERVSTFKPLPRSMLSNYIHETLTPEILKRAAASERGIVVAQALYLNIDRNILLKYLRSFSFDVGFYWVQTSVWRNIRQLLTRKNGGRWVAYYLMNKPWFEKPNHQYWTLNDRAAQLGIY